MSFQFKITVTILALYSIYCLLHQPVVIFAHCAYTLIIILQNSKKSQQSLQFHHIHPPDIPIKQNLINQPKLQPVQSQTKNALQTQNNKDQYKEKEPNTCKICLKLKPPRYYHCRRCRVCIFKMDHHCQWLDSCIGQYNFKIYLHILINLQIIVLYSMTNILLADKSSWLSFGKICRFLCSGFGMWQSGSMLLGFIQMIRHNQTLIETYKKVKGPKKQFTHKLAQIFGTNSKITYKNVLQWMIPTYASLENQDIWEQTHAYNKEGEQQEEIQQYTYADQYIYGSDDLDQYQTQAQNKIIKQSRGKTNDSQKQLQVKLSKSKQN